MRMMLSKNNNQEKEFLTDLGRGIFLKLTKEFEDFIGLELSADHKARIDAELALIEQEFFDGLDKAYEIAEKSFENGYCNKARMRYYNPEMDSKLKELSQTWPNAAEAFVIGGLLFKNQIAGIKNLYGLDETAGAIIDVLGSATSIALGAHNPYTTVFDRIEDALKVRDNICTAYHPGIRQLFFLNKISKLYPCTAKTAVSVHSESSGAIVDSIAIESALAYIEKHKGSLEARVLAVDGTWAGSYGASREATGFGVSDFGMKRSQKALFIDRCLTSPTKNNKDLFLSMLKSKIDNNLAAGLYIEPDIIGDSGIELVDPEVLREALFILREHRLPVIADCVQQLGRTGSYWGENVESILKGYPWLIVTTAKSASNGQAFGYTIMPKEIADCAYPLSQLSTNQFNGPLLRAVAVSEIMSDGRFQNWLCAKGEKIAEIADKYNISSGENGLRGKFMNRAVYVESNDNVKLVQIALLVEDGILIGALPQSLRYQPMLLDYSSTNELVAQIIFRRVNEIMKGNISQTVKEIFDKTQGASGLAR